MNRTIIFLISLLFSAVSHAQTMWGDTDHREAPWVKCTSRPYDVERGLDGRHIALWASHGRYYDNNEYKWRWQRPALFGTTEDLFTQTIVVPYLIPMLENAGAVVFTPRERDWQRHEVIVDNDNNTSFIYYREQNQRNPWIDAPFRAFAFRGGNYREGENPFEAGTARQCETTHSRNRLSTVSYQPQVPETGRYAVYVSYQTVDESVPDAHYTVWHQGQRTDFAVNQQMGGGTWVYLGTFDFDEGCSDQNCVVLTNLSQHKGFVTTDAVRFGGGMGNIERGGRTSGLPRCLEGARYYAQWAGMPTSVYSSKEGLNDYGDDINVRSLMLNELCGGSAFAPDSVGRRVPIELSLAVHSDAGHTDTGLGVYGSLSICTTQKGDSLLAAGKSREMSYELAAMLLDNTTDDLRKTYGQWEARALYDRNYSETRVPIVPSAILETMSHQNFGDMLYGQDPNFRFTLARSIYKTVLRYVTSRHGLPCTVQPLPPDNFHIEFTGKDGEVRVSWNGVADDDAEPTGYVLYIAQDSGGYDNGTLLRGSSCNVKLNPGVLYRFRVAAINDGGRSFPTEELTALYTPKAKNTILVVNGFHRLSSPAVSAVGQGFDLTRDIGVSYGRTAGWLGLQRVFDDSLLGVVDSTGLGFTTNELEGQFIAGNTFDYVRTHAEAIRRAGKYNIVSASMQAVENGDIPLAGFSAVDLVLGLERNDGHSLKPYKTFTDHVQWLLHNYVSRGGRLMVSGAYIGSDMTTDPERKFLADVLKVKLDGVNDDSLDGVRGLGLQFNFFRHPNEHHYAATHTDVLMPAALNSATVPERIRVGDGTSGMASASGALNSQPPAFPAMVYANGTSAAVAYQGADYCAFTMGFPFECIRDAETRNKVMFGILNFLLPK